MLAPALLAMALLAWGAWWLANQGPGMATAPPTAHDGRQVRIATWNLRNLSDQATPDLVTIARLIRESGFDLVAIQEVRQRGQTVQRLRRQLNEPWRMALSERAGEHERFAFLYRSDRLELVGEPRLLSGPEAAIFARPPFMATFRAGQFDFTAITVHSSFTNVARRRSETETLSRYVRQLAAAGPERDIIILGDFNEQRSQPNLHYFLSHGWRPLNSAPTNLSSTEVYDNLMIHPQYTREWTGRAGVVRFDETVYGNDDRRAVDEVSDHRAVWADFATAGPDDD